MNFIYHNLFDDILENIEINSKSVYVFSNSLDKNYFDTNYKKELFTQNPIFMNFNEFKERIFLTDKFMLKEEKRTFLLYEALSPQIKEKLKIRTYYDFIDYGENLLKLFKELNEYKVSKLIDLEKWQEESFELMKEIYDNFINILEKNNYIVPELIENMDFFNKSFFEKYENIVFINVLSFTPVEKDILEELEKSFNLILHLKMSSDSYDEKGLKFKSLILDEAFLSKINIFEVKNNFETMLNTINLSKNHEEISIFSCDIDNNNFNSFISKNYISVNKDTKLEVSELYKFLKNIGDFIENIEIIKGESVYKIDTFFRIIQNKQLAKYFGINDKLINVLEKQFLADDYKYINFRIVKDNIKNYDDLLSLESFFGFVDSLLKNKRLEEFVTFLSSDDFNYKFFIEKKYPNLFDKYFEALTEIQSIEMLGYKFHYDILFDKKTLTQSLFKLILKYLKAKPIDFVSLENKYKIEDFNNISNIKKDLGIIIDISSETFPPKPKAQFLLNNKQKKLLGLPNIEEEKEIYRYNFFNSLSNFKECNILSLRDIEKNIDSSSFVDELILKYNLKINEASYKEEDLSRFIKNLMYSENPIESSTISDDSLLKTSEDIGNPFLFGAYDFNESLTCLYRFFLRYLKKVGQINRDIDYDFENRTMGIIVHSFFEEIFKKFSSNFISGDFNISDFQINEIFERVIRQNIYKIPKELDNYLHEIIVPYYKDNLKNFLKILEKKSQYNTFLKFREESQNKKIITEKNGVEIGIKGRADLVVEGIKENYVFDIKTGKALNTQLPFYELLYFNEGQSSQKYVYNAWDNELTEDKNFFSMDEFKVSLENFVAKDKFTRAEKESTCNNCEYQNICRMRWENE